MNNRIMGAVADIGLGHIKRLLPVAKQLEQDGYEFHLCLSKRNCELARAEGFNRVYPVQEMSWVENAYGVDIPKTMYNIFRSINGKKSLIKELLLEYRDIRYYTKLIKPTMAISDGNIPLLRRSMRSKILYVFITNVKQPQYPFYLQIPFKLPQYFSERYMKHAEKIIFADFPPPRTISAYSLGNPRKFKNIEFVGPLIDMQQPAGIKDEKFILVMASGTPQSRKRFLWQVAPLLDQYCEKNGCTWKMLLGLNDSNLTQKNELHEICGYVSTKEKEKMQRECSVILQNASQTTCFEAIKNLKPSLLIPTKNQPEQEGNARRMQEFGLGVYLREKEFERDFAPSIELIIDNMDYFSKNLREFGSYAKKFDGVGRTVDIIESLV